MHRSFLTYVATVVQVQVDDGGQVQIKRVDTALDAGTVVNPEMARQQFEGAAAMGTSIAFYGEITATNGVIDQSNFDSYQMARINVAPRETSVYIVPSEAPPAGIGEPGLPPFATGAVQRDLRRNREAHTRIATFESWPGLKKPKDDDKPGWHTSTTPRAIPCRPSRVRQAQSAALGRGARKKAAM